MMQGRLPALRAPFGDSGQRAEVDVFAADGTGKTRLLLEVFDAASREPGVAEPARVPGNAR
jgi:hypothetical protein